MGFRPLFLVSVDAAQSWKLLHHLHYPSLTCLFVEKKLSLDTLHKSLSRGLFSMKKLDTFLRLYTGSGRMSCIQYHYCLGCTKTLESPYGCCCCCCWLSLAEQQQEQVLSTEKAVHNSFLSSWNWKRSTPLEWQNSVLIMILGHPALSVLPFSCNLEKNV